MKTKIILTIGILCSLVMLRLAFWQYQRHLYKKVLWEKMLVKANSDLTPLDEAFKIPTKDLLYRRIRYKGQPMYEHEIKIMNRRKEGVPGFHLLVPIRIAKSSSKALAQRKDKDLKKLNSKVILVNRGFVPLALEDRTNELSRPKVLSGIGIVKPSNKPKGLLAPKDPLDLNKDKWLRVNLELIRKTYQLNLADFWLEAIATEEIDVNKIFYSEKGGKDDILNLVSATSRRAVPTSRDIKDPKFYPTPDYSTEMPPNRHLGYVFEWTFLAILTVSSTFFFYYKEKRWRYGNNLNIKM